MSICPSFFLMQCIIQSSSALKMTFCTEFFLLIYECSWQEKAAQKEELEKQRQQKAEEKFQEWLTKANDKRRENAKTSCDPASEFIFSYCEMILTKVYKFKYKHL